MKRFALAALISLGTLAATSAAMACTSFTFTDPATGETYESRSPEWFRREQAGWRTEADTVFIAQAREARMVAGSQLEFTLVPITSVYGGPVPEAQLLFRWYPGATCNTFQLELGDLVVVYADVDQFGWSVLGLTIPDQLQDQPPGFRRTVREVDRGIIQGPALPE